MLMLFSKESIESSKLEVIKLPNYFKIIKLKNWFDWFKFQSLNEIFQNAPQKHQREGATINKLMEYQNTKKRISFQ